MMNNNHKMSWGSHVPLHKAILETFNITGIMELGIGYNSTPIFFNSCEKVISIETDKEWIEKIKKDISETKEKQLVYQPIDQNVIRQTRRKEVPEKFLNEALSFWMNYIYPDNKLTMLFIDSISSLRYEALTKLYSYFDIITFHDYQKSPPGYKNHYEGGLKQVPEDYQLFVDQTFIHHTGLLVKNNEYYNTKLELLMNNHRKQVLEYLPNFNPRIKKGNII